IDDNAPMDGSYNATVRTSGGVIPPEKDPGALATLDFDVMADFNEPDPARRGGDPLGNVQFPEGSMISVAAFAEAGVPEDLVGEFAAFTSLSASLEFEFSEDRILEISEVGDLSYSIRPLDNAFTEGNFFSKGRYLLEINVFASFGQDGSMESGGIGELRLFVVPAAPTALGLAGLGLVLGRRRR
ncbi:MAG: hypothetical protein AAGK04_12690, partial [Planctomycetota bacterium]